MPRCCRVATILPLLTLGLAACNNFTMFSVLGEPRIGFGEPIEIRLTGSANYPISASTPVHILVRPEFVNMDEGYHVRVEQEEVILVYPKDMPLTTDEGYVINLVWDGNDNFENTFAPDTEDYLGWYNTTAPGNIGFLETQFTKAFPGDFAPLLLDVPSVPLDGNEPDNDDPTAASRPDLFDGMPILGQTIHAPDDLDWYEYAAGGGQITITVSQSAGKDPITMMIVVCDPPQCAGENFLEPDEVDVALGLTTKVGTPPVAQTYSIGVGRVEGSALGYYDIVITSP